MNAADHYQAIVIGSGQGGTPLCMALAQAGLRTALVEREHVGGTCINEGCTPTKTMVASARVAYLARRGADYGVHTGDIRIDLERVRQRKRDIVNSFRGGSQARHREDGQSRPDRRRSQLHRPDVRAVRLKDGGERSLTGENFFINAGARPSVPALDGLTDVPYLNSTSIMELDAVPEHLLVLGGGYVGLEFGQMFRRFGSRVTIVQAAGQLLGREDPDVGSGSGRCPRTGRDRGPAQRRRIARGANGIAASTSASAWAATPVELEGSHLLVATGRTPNTDSLNVAAAGIDTDARGFIEVNDRLETSRRRHLRARRHQGRAGLHAHLLRRLPHPPHEPDREAGTPRPPGGSCPTRSSSTRSSAASA